MHPTSHSSWLMGERRRRMASPTVATMKRAACALAVTALLSSCANVPKEVVELSYAVGQDMTALRTSYRTLIRQHYKALRAERQQYLDREWKPVFVRAWIADGHLVQMASGKEAYSASADAFVRPTPGKEEAELLDGVSGWAEDAVDMIEKKRRELMAPLDQEERELDSVVDDAFQRIMLGNAMITAHLNSLRKVQEVQDEFLKALNLNDLRVTINETLASASDRAEKALIAVREADQKIGAAGEVLKKTGNPKHDK